jgi:deleted-in-malignant-brain-tumors protein 1
VKLVNGGSAYEGRVEVCLNGNWGTVCDDGWDASAARVVCRQLGFPDEQSFAYIESHFGEGIGSIAYDDVHCIGDENSFSDCFHFEDHNCDHQEDAGVVCSSESDSCTENTLRLSEGKNEFEGRVEVCTNNVWGAVCDDSWDFTDAQVVCRQLGFSPVAAIAYGEAYHGQGQYRIIISDVLCSGTESSLNLCTFNENFFCDNGEEAGVACPGIQSTVCI